MKDCRICVAENCDCLCKTCEITRKIYRALAQLDKEDKLD